MSSQPNRPYISRTREEKARQTKLRILHAAKKLFQDQGFECVTIDQIALEAQVSAPTIYALYQSKRGVLKSLIDEAFPAEQHAALVNECLQEKSLKKRLIITAKISRQLYDAEKAQIDLFRGLSGLAPEFKELEKEREQRRYTRQKEATDSILMEKSLINGLSTSKALDIIWAMTGRDMYRMLVVERGWSSDQYEEWLAQLLIQNLTNS